MPTAANVPGMAAGPAKVAVLLAAYNGREWIEAQLASIQAQVRVSVNVYISVDPCTDDTEAWCADYALAHSNVVLLPSSGPFKGASRNFFRLIRDVEFSAYDYVAFSDQDDVWYPDKLERAIAALRNSGADGYSSNVVAFWNDGRRLLVNKAQPQVRWDYLFEAAGPGCTYVLNRTLALAFKALLAKRWDAVQRIDLHDWFCYAFARSHGYRWLIDPTPGLDYRQHDRNQVGVNDGVVPALARWRKITDGWWFNQVWLTASLLQIANPFMTPGPHGGGAFAWLKLASNSTNCRRRLRDRAVLSVICLYKAIFDRR